MNENENESVAQCIRRVGLWYYCRSMFVIGLCDVMIAGYGALDKGLEWLSFPCGVPAEDPTFTIPSSLLQSVQTVPPEERATIDLIEELDREAQRFTDAVLVVGFEGRSELIAASEDDRLERLDAAVEEGGLPFCLLAYRLPSEKDSHVCFYSRLVNEQHGHEDEALAAMSDLLALYAKGIVEGLKGFGVTTFKTEDAWVNSILAD